MKHSKKILAGVLTTTLILSALPVRAEMQQQVLTNQYQQTVGGAPSSYQSAGQKDILQKWQSQSDDEGQGSIHFQVSWDTKQGIPTFVQGFTSEETVNSHEKALDFVKDNGALFNLEGGELEVKSSETDDYGMTHYRVVQKADGIPIYGKELIVHTNEDNKVYAVNGDLQPGLETAKWSQFIKYSDAEYIKKAKDYLDIEGLDDFLISDPDARPFLYSFNDNWYLVSLVTLQFNEPYPANYKIFVDAQNGKIVNAYNAVADGQATCYGTNSFGQRERLNGYEQNGTYYLYDTTHPAVIETYTLGNRLNAALPGTRVQSSTNQFNRAEDRVAVDTHANLSKVYEFFKTKFGRRGFDDRDSNIKASVHYYDQQSGSNNAFWNGRQMLFGDGDGKQFGSFGAALDVVAHEFTHAVTQYTANLEYYGQSGAINESISDVFGILCEGPEDQWWLMGEDAYTPGRAGDALRDAKDPGSVDQAQPGHMDEYVNTTRDNGGVHINSGIPNKAFYHIASNVGFDDSGKIYYRALTTYLTKQSDFMDLRNAVLQSTADIFGQDSSQYKTVQQGFSNVGLGTVSATDTYESNDTAATAYGPLESGKEYVSYISSSSDVDIYKFDSSADGMIIVNLEDLPKDYDLYLYDSNGKSVASSETDGTRDERINYEGAKGLYYIKIIGYNGEYSASQPYKLTVQYPTKSSEDTNRNDDEDTTEPTWQYEDLTYNTPHDYPSNYRKYIKYEKSGASYVALHFSRFETEKDYDFVEIYDANRQLVKKYSGTLSPFWVTVKGDTAYVQLVSDAYVNGYGYQLDKAAFIK